MIGVEFKLMQSNKKFLVGLICYTACALVSAQASTSTSATLNVNATFQMPTCNIDVPARYNLSNMTVGHTDTHPPLLIKWRCNNEIALKTHLTAKVIKGILQSDNQTIAMGTNGPLLSLEYKKNNITFDGTKTFCTRTLQANSDEAKCSLTPVTTVHRNVIPGAVAATIMFSVGYK